MLQALDIQDRIDLAREPAFQLGTLHVDPSRLVVASDQASLQVEPRVMAVLVALAQAEGRVVSRDELVDRCWDGRIVGDNAIQRVISRLRHVAGELGGFEIETITKVGYLARVATAAGGEPAMAMPAPEAAAEAGARALDRRVLLGGALLLAVSGAGVVLLRGRNSAGPTPADGGTAEAAEARRFVDKAREVELLGGRDSNAQALAYLTRATEIDPANAEAWGSLALAYQRRMDHVPDPELPALAEQVQSAARRALALEPKQTAGAVALATIRPNFRNWAANERTLRALAATHAPHPALEQELGWLLCDTGRWREAIACFRRALVLQPYHPGVQLILAWALWGSGALVDAERILEEAHRLWPHHRSIWQTRFDFLALGGRTEAAIAMLEDEAALPAISPGQAAIPVDALRRIAGAIASRDAAERERAGQVAVKIRGAIGTYSAVAYLAALGQPDAAFAMLEGYFFGDATRPAPAPLARRKTSILFSLKGAPLRADTRWATLVQQVGLTDYWRETGTRADLQLGMTTNP